VLGEEMAQPEQAVQALSRGIGKLGENADLQAELAARLLKAGQFGPAVVAARRVLEQDVMRAPAWRQLSEAFKGLGRTAESTLAIAPLVALGAANDLERATLSARPARAGAAHAGSFDASEFSPIDLLPPDDAAARLLSLIAEGLGKVQPPELERPSTAGVVRSCGQRVRRGRLRSLSAPRALWRARGRVHRSGERDGPEQFFEAR